VIVLDSSAAVDYLLARGPGEWVADQLQGADRVHAPHLLDVEVLGAIRRRLHLRQVKRRRAENALSDFRDLRVTRYAHAPLLGQMWDLRDNVTASDAAYVVLARALDLPLVTTDSRLARAPGLKVEVRAP
jgi:predicted nucleic acid-binding protein